MFKNSLQIFFVATCLAGASVQAMELALSVGAVPSDNGTELSSQMISKQIVFALHANGAAGAGIFANFSSRASAIDQLNAYNDEGHLIANFTSDGLDLRRSTAEQFAGSIHRADLYLKQFSGYRRYFRHPRLDQDGGDQLKSEAIATFLKENHYRPGIYTIDSYDWFIQQYINKKVAEDYKVDWMRLQRIYVAMVSSQVKLAQKKMQDSGKLDWPQILLFQECEITARSLKQLLAELKKDHQFIPYVDAYLSYQKNVRNLEFDFVLNPMASIYIQDYENTTKDLQHILDSSGVFTAKSKWTAVKKKIQSLAKRLLGSE